MQTGIYINRMGKNSSHCIAQETVFNTVISHNEKEYEKARMHISVYNPVTLLYSSN